MNNSLEHIWGAILGGLTIAENAAGEGVVDGVVSTSFLEEVQRMQLEALETFHAELTLAQGERIVAAQIDRDRKVKLRAKRAEIIQAEYERRMALNPDDQNSVMDHFLRGFRRGHENFIGTDDEEELSSILQRHDPMD
jgi:hypothetical protein